MRGRRSRDRMVVGFTIPYAITTSTMSLNPAQLVSDLRLFCGFMWFSLGTLVFPTNKIDRHDISEILLKVVLKSSSM